MQKPTLRQNGKKEVTLKIDFHFDLRELARIATRACFGNRKYLPKTQREFEEKIRYNLYQYGYIDDSFDYAEYEVGEFMNDIKQMYPNYEWE